MYCLHKNLKDKLFTKHPFFIPVQGQCQTLRRKQVWLTFWVQKWNWHSHCFQSVEDLQQTNLSSWPEEEPTVTREMKTAVALLSWGGGVGRWGKGGRGALSWEHLISTVYRTDYCSSCLLKSYDCVLILPNMTALIYRVQLPRKYSIFCRFLHIKM